MVTTLGPKKSREYLVLRFIVTRRGKDPAASEPFRSFFFVRFGGFRRSVSAGFFGVLLQANIHSGREATSGGLLSRLLTTPSGNDLGRYGCFGRNKG